MFIKLCSVFIPCECDDYYHAIAQLDVELNPEFLVAVQPYNVVRDQIFGSISRRIETATSVLLQVLYTLQRGHVQYLLDQYRLALVDTFGPAGLPAEKKARAKAARMKDSTIPKLPRDRHALGQESSKVEDQEEYDVEMDGDSSGLDQDNFRVIEDDEAHTSVSSITQQQARRLQMETMTTSETTEAAGFGSDTSPRTESGDYDELSQAGSN